MADDLRARAHEMDEAFFAGEHGRGRPGADARDASAADLGIRDDARALQALTSHGIDRETVAAMVLVPLVAVAWADRDLDDAEQDAVLEAAEASGIVRGSPSAILLASWLHERPDPELFERWKSFIVALCADMDAPAVETLRAELIGRARTVAAAAGGLFGIGRVTGRERDVLDELEHAFPA